ncbi:hypothetical protein DFH09DRAFT_1196627 [Mycena vulgaris]|nr:hypothetical protein DFH09DRAFT_1196627 [Mycena vulgaris]
MDDSQWCLDECPTCATVMDGKSLYCSAQCEPNLEHEPDLEHGYVPWGQCTSTRVSAWALDCYKSSLASSSSPGIFPSPSRRKLHLRKQNPTSWVTPDTPSHSPSSPSTSTAVESLITSSTAPTSSISRNPLRSWASPSPVPPTRPLLTKTNVYLFTDSPARRPTPAASYETSARPVTPSESWISKVAVPNRSSCPIPKQRRQDERVPPRSRNNP